MKTICTKTKMGAAVKIEIAYPCVYVITPDGQKREAGISFFREAREINQNGDWETVSIRDGARWGRTEILIKVIDETQDIYYAQRNKAKEDEGIAIEKACPGYFELQKIKNEFENQRAANAKAIRMQLDHEDYSYPVDKAAEKELKEKYIAFRDSHKRASCLMESELFLLAENHKKQAAGEKAKKLLIDGGSLEEAMNILENWHPEENMWRD